MTEVFKIVGRAYLVERFWMKSEEAWVEELNGSDCGLETCKSGSDCDTFSVYCVPGSVPGTLESN